MDPCRGCRALTLRPGRLLRHPRSSNHRQRASRATGRRLIAGPRSNGPPMHARGRVLRILLARDARRITARVRGEKTS